MTAPSNGVLTITGELSEILTPPQIAKRVGWSRKRMWSYLVRLNKKHDGLLLVNVSTGSKRPRWTVSLQSLKLLHAAWFQDPMSLQEQLDHQKDKITDLETRVLHVEKNQKALGQTVAALRPTG